VAAVPSPSFVLPLCSFPSSAALPAHTLLPATTPGTDRSAVVTGDRTPAPNAPRDDGDRRGQRCAPHGPSSLAAARRESVRSDLPSVRRPGHGCLSSSHRVALNCERIANSHARTRDLPHQQRAPARTSRLCNPEHHRCAPNCVEITLHDKILHVLRGAKPSPAYFCISALFLTF